MYIIFTYGLYICMYIYVYIYKSIDHIYTNLSDYIYVYNLIDFYI